MEIMDTMDNNPPDLFTIWKQWTLWKLWTDLPKSPKE